MCLNERGYVDARLANDPCERAGLQFAVKRNNTTPRSAAEDDVAPALARHHKAKPTKRPDCFGSGNAWEFRQLR